MRYGNLALAFVTELLTLFGFAMLGALFTGWLQLLAGAVGVIAFVGLWGVFAAPRSKRRLKGTRLLAFKIGMFAVAVLVLALAGFGLWALLLALCAVVTLGGAMVLKQH